LGKQRVFGPAAGVLEDFCGDQLADEDAEDEDDDRDSVERRS